MNSAKIVVITGVSRGLGLSLVHTFLQSAGWKVIGTGRSPRPSELPDSVEYYQFDASNAADCRNFWQAIDGLASGPITLINNAGGYIGGKFTELTSEDFEHQMEMNFFSAVHMTRSLADAVDAARIITIISATANQPSAKNTAYGASKAAEKYFFQALQKEMNPSQFKMTNIYPDAIATQGSDVHAIKSDDLALIIRDMAEFKGSYYVRDIVLSTDNST